MGSLGAQAFANGDHADAKVAVVWLGTVGSLITEYLARLGVGEALLAATVRTDDSDEQRAHATSRVRPLQRLWSDTVWSSEASWAGNDINGQSMMYTFAAVISPEEVRECLANVLHTNPDLLEPLVPSCAGWVEQVDRQTFRPLQFDRVYSQIPPWLPIDAIQTAEAGVLDDDRGFDADQVLAALLQKFDHAG